jgi:hypothetical protein
VEGLLILLLPLTPNLTLLLVVLGFQAVFHAILQPTIPTIVSLAASPEKQGFILGVNQSFNSVARATSPILMGFLYDLNFRLPYVLSAVLYGVAFLVLLSLPSKDVDPEMQEKSCPFNSLKAAKGKCPTFSAGCPYKTAVSFNLSQMKQCPAFKEGCPFKSSSLDIHLCPIFSEGCPFKSEESFPSEFSSEEVDKCPFLKNYSQKQVHHVMQTLHDLTSQTEVEMK